MAFYYKFGNESLDIGDIAEGIKDSLLMQGVPIVSLPFSPRPDMGRNYVIVGITEYDNRRYDILVDHSPISTDTYPGTPIFDRLSTDRLNGNIKLSERGASFGNSIPPIAEFHFEPSRDRIDFIRRTARELRIRLPSLATIGIGYQSNRDLDYSFERV